MLDDCVLYNVYYRMHTRHAHIYHKVDIMCTLICTHLTFKCVNAYDWICKGVSTVIEQAQETVTDLYGCCLGVDCAILWKNLLDNIFGDWSIKLGMSETRFTMLCYVIYSV